MSDKHHAMGFSKWPALAACPSYEGKKDDGVYDADADDYATRGSAVHSLALLMVQAGNTDIPKPEKMAEEEYETAQWFAGGILVFQKAGKTCVIDRRVRVINTEGIQLPEGTEGIYGTADLIVNHGGFGVEFEVVDLKTFSRWDDKKDCFPQLAGYALAYATEAGYDENTPVRLTIAHGGVKKLQSKDVTILDCANIARKIFDATRTDKHNVNEYCQYCRHNGNCPGWKQAVETALVPNDSPLCIVGLTQEELNTNPVKAAQVCKVVKTFAKRFKDVVDMCEAAARANGGIIEDPDNGIAYIVKTVSGKRSCDDAVDLYNGLVCDYLTQDEYLKLLTPSLKAVKDAIKERMRETASCGGRKMTIKELDAELDAFFKPGDSIEKFEER